MAIIVPKIQEHDVVELRRPVGHWSAGQQGTVVSEHGAWKLIEIADNDGAMLDLLSLPESDLERVQGTRP